MNARNEWELEEKAWGENFFQELHSQRWESARGYEGQGELFKDEKNLSVFKFGQEERDSEAEDDREREKKKNK